MFLSEKNTNTLVKQVHFYPLVPSEVSELLGLGTDMDVKWTPGSSTDTFLFFPESGREGFFQKSAVIKDRH